MRHELVNGFNVLKPEGKFNATECKAYDEPPTWGSFKLKWGERDMGRRHWFLNLEDAVSDINQRCTDCAVADIGNGIYVVFNAGDIG